MHTVYLHYKLHREMCEEFPYSFVDIGKLSALTNSLVRAKNEVPARFPDVEIITRLYLRSIPHEGVVDDVPAVIKAPPELFESALDMFVSIAGIPKSYQSIDAAANDIVDKVLEKYGHNVWYGYGSHMPNDHPVRPIPKAVVVTI